MYAIQQAIDEISETCKGKSCLPTCISNIRAFGSPPHAACCRGGVGRRAVIFTWLAAVIALIIAFVATRLFSDVVVYMDDNTYYGSSAVVYGDGGHGSGDDYVIVVTNFMGACSNCVAISQAELRQACDSIDGQLSILRSSQQAIDTATETIYQNCQDEISDISLFQSFPYTTSGFTSMTNSMGYMGNGTIFGSGLGSQGILIVKNWQSTLDQKPVISAISQYRVVAYSNGIYDYSHEYVEPFIYGSVQNNLFTIQSQSAGISNSIAAIQNTSDMLRSVGPCETNDYGDVSIPDLIIRTNTVYVTGIGQEQIDAITNYLAHIDRDQHLRWDQLNAMSNNLAHVDKNLDTYGKQVVSALYSNRQTIPQQDELGTTWQDVYLQGSPTSWGYNPTNVLERIELLLYGVSGVGTNGTIDIDIESQSSAAQGIITSVGEITTDVEDNQSNVESLGEEIVSFFGTFTSFAGRAMVNNEQILPSVQVQIDGQKVTVPALAVPSSRSSMVQLFNRFSVLLRAACVCLYLLGALMLLWYYWGWFSKYALAFCKWASEILNSLFAS